MLPGMPRVKDLQKVKGFAAADFTDNDPVGLVSERSFQQITDCHCWNLTLENNGIVPSIVADLSREALREGKDTQLEKAVEVVRNL